ncbi:LysR family transcriptional regulator [Nonomuraea typhae]|uniref:LysR family transcriptional regulator n=1 Tax=Nonomuraea typhae TaxID=2603600 RepID=UPI0012F79EDC|nr:LysR family transcriptional regulator [Nonomuraea typhae]
MRQTQPSLDLLIALDVLLDEGSVSGAAHRLHLSEPAMSRTLGRIRKAMGDPILVRSGQRMVPTPRALAVRAEVRALVEGARRVFTPPGAPDPATLVREFVILASDPVIMAAAAPLLTELAATAPGVRLRFISEGPGDQLALRDGLAELEVTIISDPAPETLVEPLASRAPLGVVRAGHPLLDGPVTPERFAAFDHVIASRKGRTRGPIDDALAALGLARRVGGTVPTFSTSLLVVRETDLVGMAAAWMVGPTLDALGLVTFPLPLELPPLVLSQAWHPRHDVDPAHAWLRERVRAVFAGGEEEPVRHLTHGPASPG